METSTESKSNEMSDSDHEIAEQHSPCSSNASDDNTVDLDLSQYYEDEFASDKSTSDSSSEEETEKIDLPYESFKNSPSQSNDEDGQRESMEGSDQEEETLKKDSPILSASSIIEDHTQIEELENYDEEITNILGSSSIITEENLIMNTSSVSLDVSEEGNKEMEEIPNFGNTEIDTENDPYPSEDSLECEGIKMKPLERTENIDNEEKNSFASLVSTEYEESGENEPIEASEKESTKENSRPVSPEIVEKEFVEQPSEDSAKLDEEFGYLSSEAEDEPCIRKTQASSTDSLTKNELQTNQLANNEEQASSRRTSICSMNSSTGNKQTEGAPVDKRAIPKQVYTAKIEHKPIKSKIAVSKIVTQSKSMPLKTSTSSATKKIEKPHPIRKSIHCDGDTYAKSRRDVRATYSSMTTFHTQNRNIAEWLSRKDEEKRRKQLMLEEERRLEEEHKLVIIELERKNFQEWLQRKVKLEHQKKAESLIKSQTEKLVEKINLLEKHRQDIENEERFKTWLQKKEEENKKKKRIQELKERKAMEEKEKRVSENEDAYKRWLENSKYKPRPIPLNRGLDSLRSAVSVGYINPIPWVPNIEPSSLED